MSARSSSRSSQWHSRSQADRVSVGLVVDQDAAKGVASLGLMPRTPYSSGSRLQQRRERSAASSRISLLHPPPVAAASVVRECGTCTELLSPVPSDESALLVEGS